MAGKSTGESSEKRAALALTFLLEREYLDGFIYVPLSLQGRQKGFYGVDFFVIKENLGFPIEIKSSKNGAKGHRAKGYRTPIVVVPTRRWRKLSSENKKQERIAKTAMDILGILNHFNNQHFWSRENFHYYQLLLNRAVPN